MTAKADSSVRGAPLRIGVSACLLGQAVRFDGGHKRNDFLTEVFGRFVEFVPVCPEFELGLGVPRESIRLVRDGEEIRLVGNRSGADHTAAMRQFAARRAAALAREELSGYVLKKDSPSCGMMRVRVHGANGRPVRDGRGLFAQALMARYPHLPVEEEGRLNDPRLRENFIERVFAYRRLRDFFASRWSAGGLAAFHAAHHLQLLAHAPRACAELGRMAARAKSIDRRELRDSYEREFMAALAKIASPARHVKVLRHIAGYFRGQLDADSRRELAALIDGYRRGLIPLIAPISLMRHYARRFGIADLAGQVYLEPHPMELLPRNRV